LLFFPFPLLILTSHAQHDQPGNVAFGTEIVIVSSLFWPPLNRDQFLLAAAMRAYLEQYGKKVPRSSDRIRLLMVFFSGNKCCFDLGLF
jgi:hypothetical protein